MNQPHHFAPHHATQYARAARYVKRLRDCYAGRGFTRHAEDLEWEDDMYSTFIHIHHIKDWFADRKIKKEAANYAIKDADLSRCSLIANLWKHGHKNRKLTVRLGRLPTHTVITASNNPALIKKPTIRFPFVFEHDGCQEEMDAADLAERGLRAWAKFIADHAAAGKLDFVRTDSQSL